MDLAQGGPKKLELKRVVGTFVPVILFLSAILLGFLYTYPKYKDIPIKKDEIERLNNQDKVLENKIKKLNDLVDFKEIVDEDSKLVDFALPSSAEVPLLLTEVQKIANDSGLEITNLSYSAQTKTKDAKTDSVAVLLSAKGSFSEAKTFLYTIEKAARLVDISTMRFTLIEGSNPESLSSSDLEITLGLNSPYLFVDSKAVVDEPIVVDIRDNEFVSFINRLKEFKIYETKVDTSNIGKDNPFNK